MECRAGCGACCIAISISTSIPGHSNGKAAGARCRNLDKTNCCTIYKSDVYPAVCKNLKPQKEMCKETREDAYAYLVELEELTKPN